jgi:peptidoglycan hydrolase CwlO-like protein
MLDRKTLALLGLSAVVLSPGVGLVACVTKDKFDAALKDAQDAHTALTASQEHGKADDAEIARLHDALNDAQAQMQDRDQKLSDLTTSDHNVQAQLDESTAISAKLRSELERLGKNVDQMLQEKGTLSKALDDAKQRLTTSCGGPRRRPRRGRSSSSSSCRSSGR